jgi:hypothetical protein
MHSDEKVGKYLDSRVKRDAITGSTHLHERNQQNCPNGFIQHLLDCRLPRLTRLQIAFVAKNIGDPQKMTKMSRQNHYVLPMAIACGKRITEDEPCES